MRSTALDVVNVPQPSEQTFQNYWEGQSTYFTENRNRIMLELINRGIEQVEITYSGCGDSGSSNSIQTVPESALEMLDKWRIDLKTCTHKRVNDEYVYSITEINLTLSDALEDFLYHTLQSFHPGWEINDGSDGTLTINAKEGDCLLEHCSYYTESQHDEHEF